MLDKTDGFMPKNCMSGYDFELWVQGILTALKFDAKRTKGNDNGVDIIATLGERGSHLKYYIQCKFHNRPVGKTPVQEVYTGCNYFGNDGYPVVITNNRMSSETKAYAKQIGVELYIKWLIIAYIHNLSITICGTVFTQVMNFCTALLISSREWKKILLITESFSHPHSSSILFRFGLYGGK